MAETITAEELRRKLLDPHVPESELAQYFVVDEEASEAFAPELALNSATIADAITVTGARSGGLLSLANSVARLRRRIAFEAKIADAGYRGPIIVSEGDSWFEFPILLKDTIDWLSEDFAILSLDAAGDTMVAVEKQSEFFAPMKKFGASIFLLSAGGNDLLASGSLAQHLGRFATGSTAASLLLPSFDSLVGQVLLGYRRIFTRLAAEHPKLAIFVHGYDNVVPRHKGPWLGKVMEGLGIVDGELQQALVARMIERFNHGLAEVAAEFHNVGYLDLRGTVQGRWHDELHPLDAGYHDVAARFHAAIDAFFSRPRGGTIEARSVDAEAMVGAASGTPRGLALTIGINSVDRTEYKGDFADLRCAEFDAVDMADLVRAAGFADVTTLLGQQATRQAVMDAIRKLAGAARAGDLAVITYAGHGSQLPDYSGDEDDGADETWCLFDDQLVDDEIYELLAAFAPGVRVLMLSDSCHSGTVFRSVDGQTVPVSVAQSPEITRALPPLAAALTARAHADRFEQRQAELAARGWAMRGAERLLPVAASVRLVSGCTDAQSSYDDVANGHFTAKLKQNWARGSFVGDYEAFVSAIRRSMRTDQTPEHRTLGAPSPVYDAQHPFEI